MLTFLFWNLSGNPLLEPVVRLVERHQVDVLMLAECPLRPQDLLPVLNPPGTGRFHFSPGIRHFASLKEAVVAYTRFPSEFLRPIEEDERTSIRRLQLPGKDEILLVLAHLPSKLRWSSQSQGYAAVELARMIRNSESRAEHTRTLLVGDLNMNPFEDGVLSANGLHAVMSRQIAAQEQRQVQSRSYPYFYNPMWGHFGDVANTPAGTFYYRRAEMICHFWNMFDQVLLRPALLPMFHNEDLRILTTDGQTAFVTSSGTPNKNQMSDHLPILFTLHI